MISTNYGSFTHCWKLWIWVRFDVILRMIDIYINSNLNPLTKFTSSSRSTEFKYILPWNIPQMFTRTIPISLRISYTMKWGILFWVYWKVNGNWYNNMIWISQYRGSNYITNTCVRRNNKIQKSRTKRVIVRDLSRKVNHLSKIILDRKIIAKFSRSIRSTRIG